jgi:uncharacterized protein (DUF427 family)
VRAARATAANATGWVRERPHPTPTPCAARPRALHCPYKGDANYFTINANGKSIENSIWTYEAPFPAMTEIAGHLSFYPDKVTIEEVA